MTSAPGGATVFLKCKHREQRSAPRAVLATIEEEVKRSSMPDLSPGRRYCKTVQYAARKKKRLTCTELTGFQLVSLKGAQLRRV